MSTTLMIVEFLIIGFQVLAWIVLLLIPPTQLKDLVVQLKEWGDWVPVVGVLVLAVAYTLGIVFDRFLGFCISKLLRDNPSDPATVKRNYILLRHPEANRQLENSAPRTRLLRATSFNALIIASIGYSKCGFSKALGLLLVGVAFTAFLAWRKDSRDSAIAVKGFCDYAKAKEDEEKAKK
jgi:hypothetical protein